ncbi:hypothetical protein Hanom_Chr02g00101181 [Helianthus anomalus]
MDHFGSLLLSKRVNYKFWPLCLHQIAGAVLLAKSLQAVSLTFQNLARFFSFGPNLVRNLS